MDDGRAAAERIIGELDEPRRTHMRHLHEVILEALPDIDVSVWDYSGPLIGYGGYDYTTSRGPAGRWFAIGLASRKRYISLYSMATREGRYLVEAIKDRFPGTKAGKSCLNITRPDLVDDGAVADLVRETWDQLKDGPPQPA